MACLVADYDHPDGIEIDLQSEPVPIDVHPLPPAPDGFSGTVADARLSGAVDRASVRADESVTLTFRLTGRGNLRLAQPPAFERLADFEVFDRKVEDSLAVEEGNPTGTKLVRYTLLPRRPGTLELPALRYVVYVPGEGYRTLDWAGARIDVAPGLGRGPAAGAARFTLVPTAAPGGTPWTAARPWAGAALLLLAFAFALPRLVPRPAGLGAAEEAARASGLDHALEGLGQARTRGDVREFWRRAEAALELLPGAAAADLRERIAQCALCARRGHRGRGRRGVRAPGRAAARTAAARRARCPACTRRCGCAALTIALIVLGVARRRSARSSGSAPRRTTRWPRACAWPPRRCRARPGRRRGTRCSSCGTRARRRPASRSTWRSAPGTSRRIGETTLWTERARRLDPRTRWCATSSTRSPRRARGRDCRPAPRAHDGRRARVRGMRGRGPGLILLGLRRRWSRIAGGLVLVIGIVLGAIAARAARRAKPRAAASCSPIRRSPTGRGERATSRSRRGGPVARGRLGRMDARARGLAGARVRAGGPGARDLAAGTAGARSMAASPPYFPRARQGTP
jgi:hypothetical protein